jgi:hypothetical protein
MMETDRILVDVVYNTQNRSVSGLYPLSAILKWLQNTTFRKLGLFPSSRDGKAITLMSPLERANLSHCSS